MLDKKDIEVLKELIQTELKPVNDNIQSLKVGQNKHSILLENMNKKLNTVIEGQQAQREQIDRHFQRLENNMKDENKEIKKVTARNSYDVQLLKESI